ncbi:MAG: alpha/beta hydrolase [Ignavibacteriae bacterium]|nr:alpha/beta hydrolase [Ignavibacteriota bacterium]
MQLRFLLLKYVVVILLLITSVMDGWIPAQEKGVPPTRIQTKKIRVNGVILNYIERGKGTPVVFVHGTLGDYRTWDGQLEAFSKNYRVISLSRRYHYPNKWTKDSTDFSVNIHARDLAAFIKALKLPPVHLIGHSYGAFISFLVARDHPELIRSLTLGEPPMMPLLKTTPEGDSLLAVFTQTSIVPSGEAFKNGNYEEGVRRFVNGILGDSSYEKLPLPARKSMMDNAKELKGETSSPDIFPPVTCEDVQKVKSPTLLLDGERSPKVFSIINNVIERCLVNKERVVIAAASHGLEFENPQAFNESVFAFLGKH